MRTEYLSLTCILLLLTATTFADEYADSVIRYDCTHSGDGNCPDEAYQDATQILGEPDGEFVSLGFGGLIEIQFDNNFLSNSGDSGPDLFIYELGADIEGTAVSARPTPATAALLGSGHDENGDGFYEVGATTGGVATIDIDAAFPGYSAGALRFDAIQLIDTDFESSSSGTHGADVDAVEALEFVLLGDMNGDGAVNLLDVALFVEAVANSTYVVEGDMNGDGIVNLLDVAPFVAVLGN